MREATTLAVPVDHPVAVRLRRGAVGDLAVLRRQWNDKTKKFFSEIRVDDVRAALGLFQRAAGAGGFRLCILDSAEDLNRSSANALLKIIEEPPPRSVFLILAHQPSQVMPTLLSRCRQLFLGALDEADVTAAPWAPCRRRICPPGWTSGAPRWRARAARSAVRCVCSTRVAGPSTGS